MNKPSEPAKGEDMKKRTAIKVADLHLWHVEVEYDKFTTSRGTTTLRITTRTHSIDKAILKARSYIQRNKYDWPGAKIESAELQGQIQA